jgi:hypothetical protein
VRAAAWPSVLASGLAACNYGFEGGGFPPHIRTIYIEPFANETPQFDLDQKLYDRMLEELPRKLGVAWRGGSGGRHRAGHHLPLRRRGAGVQPGQRSGRARSWPPTRSRSASPSGFIDVRDNLIRWESTRLVGRGTYNPAGETERPGSCMAIASIIEQIIDGAQSQW